MSDRFKPYNSINPRLISLVLILLSSYLCYQQDVEPTTLSGTVILLSMLGWLILAIPFDEQDQESTGRNSGSTFKSVFLVALMFSHAYGMMILKSELVNNLLEGDQTKVVIAVVTNTYVRKRKSYTSHFITVKYQVNQNTVECTRRYSGSGFEKNTKVRVRYVSSLSASFS
jgi:hypothetical protein